MSFFPELQLSRRRLAGIAAASTALPAADLAWSSSSAADLPVAPAGKKNRHRLRPDTDDSIVRALDLPIAALSGVTRGRGVSRTPVIETSEFKMMGMTWRSGDGTVRARFRALDGSWSVWRNLEVLHDAPDRDTDENSDDLRATELTWTGKCDAVQLETTGSLRAPVLALINPGSLKEDKMDVDLSPREVARREANAAGEGRVPMPEIRTRKQWGADPKAGDGGTVYNKEIRQAHIHHTVNSNSYSRDDVPGLLRGMQRYHTRNLGWSDIGYNFLIDRFGRIWTGRRGGVWKSVRGAHTLGFNNTSVGVAVIGNFETAKPNDQTIGAISKLVTWKLFLFDRNPESKIGVVSTGSDRFPAGKKVWLPVISGHRQTNETACPGKNLYAQLPDLRRRSARRMEKFTS